MIPLKPFASYLCSCPRCQRPFSSGNVIINGMRNIVDAPCGHCGANYYVDLPSGHALYSPTAIDKATGEIFDPAGTKWFSNLLEYSASNKKYDRVPIAFQRQCRHKDIVLVNCLDYLYGHCLLKLLSAQYYLDHHPDLACCILVPKQLAHLAPDGTAEVWEVDLAIKDFQHWYISLEDQIREEIDGRDTCYLSMAYSHPHVCRYDVRRFAKTNNEISQYRKEDLKGDPLVVFSYREDRLWGHSLEQQARNIAALYQTLRLAFPTIRFVVAGFGAQGTLAQGLVDERAPHYALEQERRWLRLYSMADCVIGVHGSNMLLPSGLARHVVELLPEGRFGNVTQDLLWPTDQISANEALYRVRLLPGRADLSDVRPPLVASIVVDQLAKRHVFRSMQNDSLVPVTDVAGMFNTAQLVERALAECAPYTQRMASYEKRLLGHALAAARLDIRLRRYVRARLPKGQHAFRDVLTVKSLIAKRLGPARHSVRRNPAVQHRKKRIGDGS